MKIAYLFDTFPSPTETFLAREVAALRRRGLDIEIWALNAGAEALPVAGASRLWKASRAAFWRKTGVRWAGQLRNRRITHVHATWANHPALVAGSAARELGISWSFAAHARDLWVEGGDLTDKLASAKFAAVCTRAGFQELQKYGSNVIYAPHGLEIERFPFAEWHPKAQSLLLGVGRLVEKKGWIEALEAARQLQMPLELVGDGPLRSQLESARLRGTLAPDEVMRAMQRADCLLLPSQIARDGDRDGLANVLLEAAALGVPLVTTRAGGATDLVDDETGWLCEPNDSQNLAAIIRAVWHEPGETRRRCRNARRRVEERFNVNTNVQILAERFLEF